VPRKPDRPPLQEHVPLAPLTTLGLGGPARWFAEAHSIDELCAYLKWARQEKVPLHVLGGGSNVVFADGGFPGLVLKVSIRGLLFRKDGPDHVLAAVGAGEPWDAFVDESVRRGLGGVECLSGIPGLAGATPIQNVGAYGQEVAGTVHRVRAIDRATQKQSEIAGSACGFRYRHSRFKGDDRDRLVITCVVFRLRVNAAPCATYEELRRQLEKGGTDPGALPAGAAGLAAVRSAVLDLRRRKSMLADPADPDARSVGSFFENPILTPAAFSALEARWRQDGHTTAIPSYDTREPGLGVAKKVPAAWLIERTGFTKGLRRGGVGISSKHALALVNAGGTSRELLALAEEIRRGVKERFGIGLELEPVVVGGAAGAGSPDPLPPGPGT
jgi:UDP-N-acetylmuramate dehydrogenase